MIFLDADSSIAPVASADSRAIRTVRTPEPFTPRKRTVRSFFGAARTANDWDLADLIGSLSGVGGGAPTIFHLANGRGMFSVARGPGRGQGKRTTNGKPQLSYT